MLWPGVRSPQDNVSSSYGMAAEARAEAATASTKVVGDQEGVVGSTQVNHRKRRHKEQAKGADEAWTKRYVARPGAPNSPGADDEPPA